MIHDLVVSLLIGLGLAGLLYLSGWLFQGLMAWLFDGGRLDRWLTTLHRWKIR